VLSESTMPQAPRDLVSWRVGVYCGAVLGGLVWGCVSLFTIGAPGDQAQHDAADGSRLLLAALVCLTCMVAGGCLLAFGRVRVLRTLGISLSVGPLGGWLIVASLAAQHYVFGWA
jgi:predicted exporter